MSDRGANPVADQASLVEILVAVRTMSGRMDAIEGVLVRDKVAARLERVEETVGWIRDRLQSGGETLDRVPQLEFKVQQLETQRAEAEAARVRAAETVAALGHRVSTLEEAEASRKWLVRTLVAAAVTASVAAIASAGVWIVRSMAPTHQAAGSTGSGGKP